MKRLILLFAALICLAPVGFAGVIYNNGAPNQANANDLTKWIQAEDFTLSASTQITDVHFWTLEQPNGYSGPIWYAIYSNDGGTPGSILAQGTVTPSSSFDNVTVTFDHGLTYFNEYGYSFNLIDSFMATGGTTYWLGLQIAGSTNPVYWETSDPNGTLYGQEFLNSGWNSNYQEHAFNLTSTSVPEPSSLLLLGVGLVGLVGITRSKLH